MSALDLSRLEGALDLLGEYLAYADAEPVRLLVVGGAALAAAGVTSRVTYDLDVLARRGPVDGEILNARPLPDELLEAAKKVADEWKLRDDWLNANVSLFALPFDDYPSDFFSELTERTHGTSLSITYLGRTGLIYLKFHAAIDPDRHRRAVDLEDLLKLKPTESETRRVLDWLRSRNLLIPANKAEIEQVLKALGHESLS